MSKRKNIILIISVATVATVILILWLTGFIGFWVKGIGYVIENTDKSGTANGHILKGSYSVNIDLNNLKSNAGKVLYKNGEYKIYIKSVDDDSPAYRIEFRSCGTCSLRSATLISGVHYTTLAKNLGSSDMSANMSAEYDGKIYHSKVMGMGPVDNDGDYFGFYIFGNVPLNEPVTVHENSVVKLTVTNLYENIWSF